MDKYIKEMFNDVRKFCGDLKNALVASIEDTGWIRLNVTASGNNLTISDVAGSRDDNAYVVPYQIYGIKLGGVVNHRFFRRWFSC